MILKGLIDEDVVNYKKVCMTIEFPCCSFKCDKERGLPVCQNGTLVNSPNIEVPIDTIVNRYITNPITEAIVYQGLEPFDSWKDLFELTKQLRNKTLDDIVIYTGYTKCEIREYIKQLQKNFMNIIIKFGRYIPNQKSHYDQILGVDLASNNQYGEKIS